MTAARIADAFELALRTRDTSALTTLLHERVQASVPVDASYRGIDEVLAWCTSVLGDDDARLSVVERYIDEPVAVLVVLWTMPGRPGIEYTVALMTLDDVLVRIVVDA